MNQMDETYKKALIENCHLGNFDFFEKENNEFKWNNDDFLYWKKHYTFMSDYKDKENQVSQLIGEFEYFLYNSSYTSIILKKSIMVTFLLKTLYLNIFQTC
jgi:hypothetical protein